MKKTGGIIVEGAEQVGKSTFCKKLSDALGLSTVHMHKEYGFINGKFDYCNSYFIDIEAGDQPLIFDRFYVSEIAYGRMFNRNNITETIQGKIERRLRELGYIVILLSSPNREWIERDEMISRVQNIKISNYFDEAFGDLRVAKMKLNAFDHDSIEQAVQMYRRMP